MSEGMKTTASYDNAIRGKLLDGLRPDRAGNKAEQAAHLLSHYVRMCMDGEHHPYESDNEIEISAIVELVVNSAIGYSVEESIGQVKRMLDEHKQQHHSLCPCLHSEYLGNLRNLTAELGEAEGILKKHRQYTAQDILSPTAVKLHPAYPGAVKTFSLRGGEHSGNNEVDFSVDQDVVSNVAHNYYEVVSSEASLQNCYVALRYTLPDDFVSWADMNAIMVEFRTESATYLNCHVSVFVYKSGEPKKLSTICHDTNTGWSVIIFGDGVLEPQSSPWKAGDVLELYINLVSRNNYFARAGTVTLNYVKSERAGKTSDPDPQEAVIAKLRKAKEENRYATVYFRSPGKSCMTNSTIKDVFIDRVVFNSTADGVPYLFVSSITAVVVGGIAGKPQKDEAKPEDVPWYKEEWFLRANISGGGSNIHSVGNGCILCTYDEEMTERIMGMKNLVDAYMLMRQYMVDIGADWSDTMQAHIANMESALAEMGGRIARRLP